MKINKSHGSGGVSTSDLIESVFIRHFSNEYITRMEDSAVLPSNSKIAFTTDSFVVNPVFFKGGDIGKLSVCGTVNDLLMMGAVPKYLTCGFVIEEGFEISELERIVKSMAKAAQEAGVIIVSGDTKVIEGNSGIIINTSGVGFVENNLEISSHNCKAGDVLIVSGNLGEHHSAILSSRLGIENDIESDCAPLNDIVQSLIENNIKVRALRDITRGGIATVLNEFAQASGCSININEKDIPVSAPVKALCDITGLEPWFMANEGKLIAVIAKENAQKALEIMKACKYGENSAIVGHITEGKPLVTINTEYGTTKILSKMYGEGLPRIC